MDFGRAGYAGPIWYPRGGVEWAVGYSLKLREAVPSGNTNLELLSLQMAFKTTRLDEIIKAEGVGRKEAAQDCRL